MENKRRQGVLRTPPHNQPINPAGATLTQNIYAKGDVRLVPRPAKMLQAVISKRRLQHNISRLKKHIGPDVRLCVIAKADGYGHRARSLVSAVNMAEVDSFAVANVEEAMEILPFTTGKKILVTAPLHVGMNVEWLQLAAEHAIHCTICSIQALRYVSQALPESSKPLPVHLKIDSGMGRCGVSLDEATDLLEGIDACPSVRLVGVFTHFADTRQPDLSFCREQFQQFQSFLSKTRLENRNDIIRHACNSEATLRMPEAHLDMVRCGLSVYGCIGSDLARRFDVRPALNLQAPLVLVKKLKQGQSCGYGRTFIAPHDMQIGIVPAGYADGLKRNLSNKASLLVKGFPAPIIGRISMDLTVIDLTNVPGAGEGELVTLIDDRPESPCSVQTLAHLADTIPYEILTGLGQRIKRVYVD